MNSSMNCAWTCAECESWLALITKRSLGTVRDGLSRDQRYYSEA